jgi:thiamine biosynthesis lipoprotein
MSGTEAGTPGMAGGGSGSAVHRFVHHAMACEWGIHIADQDEKYAAQAARAALAEVDRLEQELSRFVPSSDIARINALRPGKALRIGMDAFECLSLAAQIHVQTSGAFDVTIGALVPGHEARDSSLITHHSAPPVGMHLLALDRGTHTVAVQSAGLVVDLGAIGKGYAVDRAAEVLRQWNISAALIHSGQSTLFALGAPAGEDAWPVAIRDPGDHAAALGSVRLRDAAVSGSGILLHGRHIIDPRTRSPADRKLGAWAIAPSAALSDAISTAFIVLSPEEIDGYCRTQPDVSAMICLPCAGGHRLVYYGTGFRAMDVGSPLPGEDGPRSCKARGEREAD